MSVSQDKKDNPGRNEYRCRQRDGALAPSQLGSKYPASQRLLFNKLLHIRFVSFFDSLLLGLVVT